MNKCKKIKYLKMKKILCVIRKKININKKVTKTNRRKIYKIHNKKMQIKNLLMMKNV